MSLIQNINIGCVGAGNMGSAIMSGLAGTIRPDRIICMDLDAAKADGLKSRHGIRTVQTIKELAEISDVIIIAVKPDVVFTVIEEMRDHIKDGIIVSIAAGISISAIEDILKSPRPVVRVMPNTPSLVGEGMSVLSPNKHVDDKSLGIINEIFSLLGKVLVMKEKMMDAVTAISGCGPAYAFTLIHAMVEGGVKIGIPRDRAILLAAQTVYGAAKMVIEGKEEPMVLRGRVASPGGSTIEAIHVLEREGFTGIVMDAVEAAALKTRKMGERK
jgi:pyrroline-5-carboxylate reductase